MNNTKEVIGEIITHFLQYKTFTPNSSHIFSPNWSPFTIKMTAEHNYIIQWQGKIVFSGYVNWPVGANQFEVRGAIAKDIDQYLGEIDKVMFDASVAATTRVVRSVDPAADVIEVVELIR